MFNYLQHRRKHFISSTITPFSNDYSLEFDGVNEWVRVPDAAELSFASGGNDLPFSIAGWVKADDWSAFLLWCKQVAGAFEYAFGTDSYDRLTLTIRDSTNTNGISGFYKSALTPQQGTWIHIGATYDGSKTLAGIALYVNGSSVAVSGGGFGIYGGMTAGASDVAIGNSRADGSGFRANGKVAHIALFDKKLSAAEMLEVYNAVMTDLRNTSVSANIVAAYHFPGGQSDYPTYTDYVGTNDGMMTNQENTDINVDVP